MEAAHEIGDAVTTERRYYASSQPADTAYPVHATRFHRRIENDMRRTQSMAFDEDQCRVRVDTAASNFATL